MSLNFPLSTQGWSKVALAGVAFLFAATLALDAAAQAYPTKPLKLVVPFPAGGPVDTAGRTIGQNLSTAFNQPVIVENRPGAGTIIGTDIVAKAAPDGYSLVMSSNGIAINPSMYKKLPYDTLTDLAPVSLLLNTPFVLVVHPSVPANSTAELVKYAKSKPGVLTYPSSGIGSGNHLSGALFDVAAGTKTLHIPFKGATESLQAIVSGEVNFSFAGPLAAMPLVRAGKLRALAVSSPNRIPSIPDLPTLNESGVPGYESVTWFGLFTTGGTPAPIVRQVQTEVAKILQMPNVKKTLSADGAEMVGSTPEQFSTFLRAEITKWARVVQEAGIKAE